MEPLVKKFGLMEASYKNGRQMFNLGLLLSLALIYFANNTRSLGVSRLILDSTHLFDASIIVGYIIKFEFIIFIQCISRK